MTRRAGFAAALTFVVFIVGGLIGASAQDKAATARVVIQTELGNIDVELEAKKAPVTVANFLAYVEAGAYDGGMFHRAVRPDTESRTDFPIQVIQGSRARGTKSLPPIALERTSVTGVKHLAGTLSMARAGTDSATSDFFICVTDTPELDFGGRRNDDGQGFAAFARVVSGMDVVKKIQMAPIDGASTGRARETLTPPIKILKISRK